MLAIKLVPNLSIVLAMSLLLANTASIQNVSAVPKLGISLSVAQDPILPGSFQTVFVKVTRDGDSVDKAYVSAKVIYPSGPAKFFNGKTDISGSWSFSLYIGEKVRTGTFTVKVAAGKGDNDFDTKKITFTVVPSQTSRSSK